MDSETDLAVIKIDAVDLVSANLGNSDTVKIGEFVLAVGNPLGMQSSVTSGIISAVNRSVTSVDGTEYVAIQTDAAINAGNSGGALVNSKGEVIGINTLKLSGTGVEGIGFAIPINDTLDIYNQLIKHGKVLRPYIGITGVDLDELTARRYNLPVGVYVQSVETHSSAHLAGLKIGDVITSINGQKIQTMAEINAIKRTKNVNDKIEIELSRDGEKINLILTLNVKP